MLPIRGDAEQVLAHLGAGLDERRVEFPPKVPAQRVWSDIDNLGYVALARELGRFVPDYNTASAERGG